MQSDVASPESSWKVAQSPFVIEYPPQLLDDIRLAVVDAFFSLPRGGAEIGGILLGRHKGERVVVTGFEPLECEHAMGPSFTLSPRDLSRLTKLLAAVEHEGKTVVGWYHSHTRSRVFLSEADLEVYNRFFPEPWQVALVMKPSTFDPTRCGFFFREEDGGIHAEDSYWEFELDPAVSMPAPAGRAREAVEAPPGQPAEPRGRETRRESPREMPREAPPREMDRETRRETYRETSRETPVKREMAHRTPSRRPRQCLR
jgi:proteasome lid subunit RPN8/RPN11